MVDWDKKHKEVSTKNLGKYAEYFTAFVTLQYFEKTFCV